MLRFSLVFCGLFGAMCTVGPRDVKAQLFGDEIVGRWLDNTGATTTFVKNGDMRILDEQGLEISSKWERVSADTIRISIPGHPVAMVCGYSIDKDILRWSKCPLTTNYKTGGPLLLKRLRPE